MLLKTIKSYISKNNNSQNNVVLVNASENYICFLSILKDTGWELDGDEETAVSIKKESVSHCGSETTKLHYMMKFNHSEDSIAIRKRWKRERGNILIAEDQNEVEYETRNFNIAVYQNVGLAFLRYSDNQIRLKQSENINTILQQRFALNHSKDLKGNNLNRVSL